MKKIIVFILTLVLVCPVANAQNKLLQKALKKEYNIELDLSKKGKNKYNSIRILREVL